MTEPRISFKASLFAGLTLGGYVAALAVWFLQFGVAGAFP